MDKNNLIKNSNSFFSEKDLKNLSISAKWTTFLGIAFIVVGIITMTFGTHFFALSIPFFFLSLYLFDFAKKIETFLKTKNKEALSKAFVILKVYFMISSIVVIGIIIIILVIFFK